MVLALVVPQQSSWNTTHCSEKVSVTLSAPPEKLKLGCYDPNPQLRDSGYWLKRAMAPLAASTAAYTNGDVRAASHLLEAVFTAVALDSEVSVNRLLY
eukprot:12345-Heterococcus_DN1.PRE.1